MSRKIRRSISMSQMRRDLDTNSEFNAIVVQDILATAGKFQRAVESLDKWYYRPLRLLPVVKRLKKAGYDWQKMILRWQAGNVEDN